MLADVGLIGFPNVGKSTFLSKVTSAKPKIADYHFTTIIPNLGVIKSVYGDSFIIADIPGIIEGASEGVGLGIQFLRHIERTRLLLHVIDVSGIEGRNPLEDFYIINKELESYSENLSKRTQIIVANKVDIMQNKEEYERLEKFAKEKNIEIYKISAATGEGIDKLINRVTKILKTLPKKELVSIEEKMIYTLDNEKENFTVTKEGKVFVVEGPAIERLMGRINLDDNESMHYFQKSLRELGIEAKLKELGVQEGDTVTLDGWELEWYD